MSENFEKTIAQQNAEPFMAHNVMINKPYNDVSSKFVVWLVDESGEKVSKIALDRPSDFNSRIHRKITPVSAPVPVSAPMPEKNEVDRQRYKELAIRGWKSLKGPERNEYVTLKKIYAA